MVPMQLHAETLIRHPGPEGAQFFVPIPQCHVRRGWVNGFAVNGPTKIAGVYYVLRDDCPAERFPQISPVRERWDD